MPRVRKTVTNDHVTQMHSRPLPFSLLRSAAFQSSPAEADLQNLNEGEESTHSYGKANTGLLFGRLVR